MACRRALASTSRPPCRIHVRTYAAFVNPAGLERGVDPSRRSKVQPASPAFYTGKVPYYDQLYALEALLKSARHELQSALLLPPPASIARKLALGRPTWKDPVGLTELLKIKVKTRPYRRITTVLDELVKMRSVARYAEFWELDERISQALAPYDKREGEEHEEPARTHAVVDEYGRSYAHGARKSSSARVWIIPTDPTLPLNPLVEAEIYKQKVLASIAALTSALRDAPSRSDPPDEQAEEETTVESERDPPPESVMESRALAHDDAGKPRPSDASGLSDPLDGWAAEMERLVSELDPPPESVVESAAVAQEDAGQPLPSDVPVQSDPLDEWQAEEKESELDTLPESVVESASQSDPLDDVPEPHMDSHPDELPESGVESATAPDPATIPPQAIVPLPVNVPSKPGPDFEPPQHLVSQILINSLPLANYFMNPFDREAVLRPLRLCGLIGALNVFALVRGGGTTGQADAVANAVARAITGHAPHMKGVLSKAGLMHRDPRVVERKKTNHPKANKAYAWVKR